MICEWHKVGFTYDGKKVIRKDCPFCTLHKEVNNRIKGVNMNIYIKSKYVDEEVNIKFGTYSDGSTAIRGFSLIGEPLFTATVTIPSEKPINGFVFLKDWSENEGIAQELVKAGIVELTNKRIPVGFCEALEARLITNSE